LVLLEGLSEYVYKKVSVFFTFSLEILKNTSNIFLYSQSIKLKTRFFLNFFEKIPISFANNV